VSWTISAANSAGVFVGVSTLEEPKREEYEPEESSVEKSRRKRSSRKSTSRMSMWLPNSVRKCRSHAATSLWKVQPQLYKVSRFIPHIPL